MLTIKRAETAELSRLTHCHGLAHLVESIALPASKQAIVRWPTMAQLQSSNLRILDEVAKAWQSDVHEGIAGELDTQ